MIRLTYKGPDLQKLRADLARRVKNVSTEVGRALAEQTAEAVKRRLSGHNGWVKIYHDAIIYREDRDGQHWAVTGYTTAHAELFKYPAENALLTISEQGIGDISTNPTAVIAQNQPWPIDVIPVLTTAYPGEAIVTIHNAGAVKTYRAARLRNLPTVIELIKNTGMQIDESGGGFLTFEKVYMDIAYLARRLELGYSGYPRIPHWGPGASTLKTQGESWATNPAVVNLVQTALKGGDPVTVDKMSAQEADEFARIRQASWS